MKENVAFLLESGIGTNKQENTQMQRIVIHIIFNVESVVNDSYGLCKIPFIFIARFCKFQIRFLWLFGHIEPKYLDYY